MLLKQMQLKMEMSKKLMRNILFSFEYFIYRVIGFVLSCLQNVTWPFQRDYNKSCQVMRIVWRRKFFMIDVSSQSDFIGIFETFTSPSHVLKHNVSLYCVTRDQAIFVETHNDLNIYHSSVSPFQYIGQFKYANKVIRMPVSAFYRLTYKLRTPKVDLSYLASTGRCGSTILAQALEKVPGMLVHAEPDSLTNLCLMKKSKHMSNSELKRLLVATISILCKPIAGVTHVCIKTRSCAAVHMSVIAKTFPRTRFLYGYRNCIPTASSYLGLMISEPVQSISLYLINSDSFSYAVPYFRRKLHYYLISALDLDSPLVQPEDMNAVELFTYMWACCITLVHDVRKEGIKYLPILYENLVCDTRAVCMEVFTALNIDSKYIDDALIAFKTDSQEGSALSRINTNNIDRRKISNEDIIKANNILKMFNLPAHDDVYLL